MLRFIPATNLPVGSGRYICHCLLYKSQVNHYTMTPNSAFKVQFDLHTRLFNNVTEDVTDEEANGRSHELTNHIKWVAGHLLHSRLNSITRVTGGEPDASYGAQFDRGATLDPNASYPSMEEIKAKWNAVAPIISERLNNIPEEVLASKSPAQAPVADDTIRGLISFLMSHEAYHVGQLSLLRKMAGKEAMSFK